MLYRTLALVLLCVMALGVVTQVGASPDDSIPVAPQIVGGVVVTPNEFPWQALLYIGGYIGGYMCGGSLISDQWVLTASHCVEGMTATQATVHLGLHSRTLNTTANPYWQSRSVSQIIKHASYNSNTMDYDIALLKLSTPVTFTAGVQPIRLAKTASDSALYAAGQMLTVSGWGRTSSGGSTSTQLRKVNVPVVSNTTCNSLYGGGITARMMCAGDTVNGGEDSCQGDSGGPLFTSSNGSYVQAGVVSWGDGCALASSPGVYTNVANLYSWVAARVPLDVAWTTAVSNGSFESGSDGAWSETSTNYSGIITNDIRITARTGEYYAWLGGADNETSVLSQNITVDSAAPFLRIYYMMNSSELCKSNHDVTQIAVNGQTLQTFEMCKRKNVKKWKALTYDARSYIGQTITLTITSTTNDSIPSSFWVDDIGFVRTKKENLKYYLSGPNRKYAKVIHVMR